MTDPSTSYQRELEFKFVPSREVQARLSSRNDPTHIVNVLKGAFDLGDYSFGECRTQKITDTYYDSNQLTLYHAHSTLRIRNEDGRIEITLKTPLSHDPGVFDRKEHSLEVVESEAEEHIRDGFRRFLKGSAPQFEAIEFHPVLTVDNHRRKYRLTRGEEKLDLCLDTYTCCKQNAKSNRSPSFEIEIEARSDAALERLSRIRSSVKSILPSLSTEDRSKYEQSVESLGLNRSSLRQLMSELYHSPNFVAWLGVTVSAIGVILALIFFLASNQP